MMDLAPDMLAGAVAARPRRTAWSLARRWLGAAGALLLGACAASLPYQPAEGDDAAKLRVRLVFPEHDRSFMSGYQVSGEVSPRAVTGTACGKAVAVPTMWSTTIDPLKMLFRASQFPRAGMAGGTAPDHSESVELQLTPGVHVVDLKTVRALGNLSRRICETQVALQLAPNRQYEILLGFTEGGSCRVESRRMEGNTFVPAQVLKQSQPGQICQGSQFKP